MKVSGKVTLLREVQKLQDKTKYLEINGIETDAYGNNKALYYSLFSSNPRQFNNLLKLDKGDIVHFSGASICGIKPFTGVNKEASVILKLDLNQAEVSIQKQVMKAEEKPVVKTQPVKKEKEDDAKVSDYGFDAKPTSELNILSNDWEGYNFGL